MRFLHLSDLHLGKRVCEFSMLEDQRYILEEILTLLDETPVDGVLLAGDLYDKPVPPAEAVRLLDWFLTQLAARKLPVFAISGNHDSPERLAFGGRVMGDGQPKYLNSSDTPVFNKRKNVYGLNFLKGGRRESLRLVEGYMDVIGMHQVGVENVVASSGTALTQGQIRLIHRFTNNITVLYDGDAAGIKAALRGIDMLLEEGMNVKVVLLPAGEDPDSFARSHSASEFAEFISQNETDFIRFKTKLLLAEAGGDPIKRSALISDIIRTVAIIPDNIARSVYIRECSTTMEIDEQVLLNEVNKIRLNKEENQAAKSVRNTPPIQSPVNIKFIFALSTNRWFVFLASLYTMNKFCQSRN